MKVEYQKVYQVTVFSYSEVCKLIQEAKALMEIVDIVGYKQYVIGECPVHQFITEFENDK